MILDSLPIRLIKSRFTGFFAFLLLSACQPASDSQSDLMQRAQHEPDIALSLANQRLAAGEHAAALHWFRRAASLGDQQALMHALQLQQREQGRLATAAWLQQQADRGLLPLHVVTAAKRAELGLWQDIAVPTSKSYTHAKGCQITLQPVASQQAGVDAWQVLLEQWQGNRQLSQLPVCFLTIVTVNSPELACSEDSSKLVTCNYDALNNLVVSGNFSQLLVIAGRGRASYNNGILQLPDNAELALLRHEFMHVLGFIDEYKLNSDAASQVCREGAYYPNLIIGEDVSDYLQHWQLTAEDIAPTPVPSCNTTPFQAYRVTQSVNVMRAYEMELPELYIRLAKRVLQHPQQLMPVQYYYAYLARQNQNWTQWQQFMQQASDWGYVDAKQALAL